MGIGYKYLQGIGVPQSCEKALKHYEFTANHVAKKLEERSILVYSDRSKLKENEGIFATLQRGKEIDGEVNHTASIIACFSLNCLLE